MISHNICYIFLNFVCVCVCDVNVTVEARERIGVRSTLNYVLPKQVLLNRVSFKCCSLPPPPQKKILQKHQPGIFWSGINSIILVYLYICKTKPINLDDVTQLSNVLVVVNLIAYANTFYYHNHDNRI